MRKIVNIFIALFVLIHFSYAQNCNYLIRLQQLHQQRDSESKHLKLAEIYEQTAQYAKAVFHYRKALSYENTPKTLSKLANVYEKYGMADKAIALRKKVYQKDSLNLLNAYRLALLYARINQPDKALQLLKKLSRTDPDNPVYHYKTGLYESDINRKLDAFLRAYRRDSLHKKTLYRLIKNYKAIQYIDSAEYYTDIGLRHYPNDAQFLRQKVITDYRRKNFNQMLYHLKKLDSLAYDSLFVYKNTGLAYLKLNRLKQAENYIRKAMAIAPKEAINHYYLGLIHERQNRLQKAQKNFKRAVELKKPSVDKEYFELGMIAKKQKKYKQALEFFRKAFHNNRQNKEALLQLAIMAEAYYKSPRKSIEYYQKYLNLFKDRDKEQTRFVKQELRKLKEKAFMSE